jgi:glycine rich protein/type IX secretion system substrate protein/PKD domain-containing protein
MGSGIFYSNKANTKKNVKKSGFRRLLAVAGIMLLFAFPFQGKAQTPSFVSGATQNIAMCMNTVNFDIDSLLGAIDVVGVNTDTWTVGLAANHGVVTGGYSILDGGNPNTPPDGNFFYTPNTGYTGSDTFSIVVTSTPGPGTATLVFYVNVLGIPGLTLGASPVVCAGTTSASISYTGLTGLGPVSANYSFTGGAQTFTVPAGITSIMFDAAGGNGGSDNVSGTPNPGLGGRMQGTLNVAPGTLLNIYVGGKGFDGSPFGAAGGFNGGGSATNYPGVGCGGAGGGASDIRLTGSGLTDRVVVAGGGGGNGYDSPFGAYAGGDGGGLTGANSMANIGGSSAMGGTQVLGGAHASLPGWVNGGNGTAGTGGDGSVEGVSGGGGGGLYGGGGGVWNGGGGGSSFADPVQTTLVTNTQGVHIGDGYVTLTYVNSGTYMINWDPTAITAGFVNVPSTAMPAGNFPISVPAAAAANVYTGTLTITNGICSTDYPISVTVNPVPDVDPGSISSQAICNGAATTMVIPASLAVPIGTNFSWTNDNTSIGLGASGTGTINSFTATNLTAIPQIANITYTDTTTLGCAGAPATFSFTVNPTPNLTSTAGGSTCSGAPFMFTAAPTTPSTTVSWSRAYVPGITSLAGSGFGNVSEVLIDTFSYPVAVAYVYTLTSTTTACNNIDTVNVTVNPLPFLTNVPAITPSICSGGSFIYSPAATTDTYTVTTYDWTYTAVPSITAISHTGTGGVNEPLVTYATSGQTATYQFFATAYGCRYPITPPVQVIVNPIPVLSSSLVMTPVCHSDFVFYTPTSATPGTTYRWSRNPFVGISDTGRVGIDSVYESLTDTTTYPVMVNYSYFLLANGCSNTQTVSVDVRPNPVLNSAHTDVVCSGAPYSYTPTSATTGTTFSWFRPVVPGISNSSALVSGNISETLTNTTDTGVLVTYAFTITDSGCFNNDTLKLKVNPTPVITSSRRDTTLCDSTNYTYTPTSSTSPAIFTWSRVYVGGISNPPATGTGAFSEELVNTTNVDATATYVYSVTANGCAGTPVDLHVTIHPTPKLTGDHNFIVCSGAGFNYSAQSNVSGTTFQYNRPYVLGISPVNRFGTGDVLNDILVDSVYVPLTTAYYYRLSANGCTNIYPEKLVVTVNPGPDFGPGILTNASNSPCSSTTFQTFGAATPPPAGEKYWWVAENASVWATSPNEQYAYVNFFSPGEARVILYGIIGATGCEGLVDYHVHVGSGVSDNPEVIYFQSQFICLESDETSYQWGYDDAVTFAPTILAGANGQNYYDPGADFVHNRYWVVTTHNGCSNKTYYNQPTGVTNVNAMTGAMKVYPNPATTEVNVDVNTTVPGEMQVEVFNLLGQKITIVPTVNKQAKINVADLPSGCYLVECYQEGVKIATSRFIKN